MKSVMCSSSAAPPARSEVLPGVAVGVGGHPARAVDTVLAHVGQLPMALVTALRLPQGVLGTGHVEDVVDDLEQDPQLRRKGTEASQSSG